MVIQALTLRTALHEVTADDSLALTEVKRVMGDPWNFKRM